MKKILIVEDDTGILNAIGEIFKTLPDPYEPLLFSGGDIAIEFVKSNPDIKLDLVISDVRIQQGDGITFIKKFKRFHPNVPFYFMTGFADVNHHTIEELGASGIISKPFKIKDLLSTITQNTKAS